jgi:hypothetical protein
MHIKKWWISNEAGDRVINSFKNERKKKKKHECLKCTSDGGGPVT